jgi:hypothetical protein
VGHTVQASLRGGVVGPYDPAAQGRQRGDEQDPPESALAHARQHLAREQERRPEIDRERAVEHLGVNLLIGGLPADSVTGDEDLDRPEAALDIGDQLVRSPGILEVRAEGRWPKPPRVSTISWTISRS